MIGIRWANEQKTGICYEDGSITVYRDDDEFIRRAMSGEFGMIGEPAILTGPEPSAEEKARKARATRDERLAATDWTQLSDVSEAVRLSYVAYRQALRDVPQQVGFPDSIEWPVLPYNPPIE